MKVIQDYSVQEEDTQLTVQEETIEKRSNKIEGLTQWKIIPPEEDNETPTIVPDKFKDKIQHKPATA